MLKAMQERNVCSQGRKPRALITLCIIITIIIIHIVIIIIIISSSSSIVIIFCSLGTMYTIQFKPLDKASKANYKDYEDKRDQFRFLENCPSTPPLNQHLAQSEN